MPGGDRTGPSAMGAMTGRAAGYCSGFGITGSTNSTFGRGGGIGIGRRRRFACAGREWQNRIPATGGRPGRMRFGGYGTSYKSPVPYRTPDPEFEKQALKNQAEALQTELDLVKKRLSEVETESAAD